ncbi:MAG TPA: hypothetical protein VK206_03305, partial [Anaerolineales bacterium]|nr:hypothetical protein [Anaerolineales bacterium]
MAANNVQETLDRILEELKSSDWVHCLNALQELKTLDFSTPAILRELERLAIQHADEDVRNSAARSLGSTVHRFIRSKINKLNRGDRTFLLKQIQEWEADGLIEPNVASV